MNLSQKFRSPNEIQRNLAEYETASGATQTSPG